MTEEGIGAFFTEGEFGCVSGVSLTPLLISRHRRRG